MERLANCRICLNGNLSCVFLDKRLHEVYEKLTLISFQSAMKPSLICFICRARLYKTYRLMQQCLKAEDHLKQMLIQQLDSGDGVKQETIKMDKTDIASYLCTTVMENINIEGTLIDVKEETLITREFKTEVEIKEEKQEPTDDMHADSYYSDLDNEQTPFNPEYDIPLNYQHLKEKTERVVNKQNNSRIKTAEDIVCQQESSKLITQNVKNEVNITTTAVIDISAQNISSGYKSHKVPDMDKDKQCKISQNNSNNCQNSTKGSNFNRISMNETHLICDICRMDFSCKKKLIRHVRMHNSERPYSCKICDKSFTQMASLKNHDLVHTGEKPYICKICDKRFTQKSYLKSHGRIHTGEKPYVCKICDKRFTQVSSLNNHGRIHTGEKPYVCKVCNKRFMQMSSLKHHEIVHTGEKPYSCKICDKSFTQRSYLKTHGRIHTGEKPYICKICDKRFTQVSSLKTHEFIHTGEKPYFCKICNKRFSRISYFKSHVLLHTAEKTYTE